MCKITLVTFSFCEKFSFVYYMPTVSSTSVPPAAEPSSSQNGSRTSNAIQKGADLLLELFNEEKFQLIRVCRENEKRFNQLKTQAKARIASANNQLANKTALFQNLSTQYIGSVRDLEAARNELQHIRVEYAKLMASIGDVGLVYMNGALHFNDTTAKIVSDFREGAQTLDMVISQINPNFDTTPLPPDHNTEAFSNEIKPSDFFLFLSAVMDKRLAHVLKMHQQSKNASFSEGNFTSMNDATLNASDSEFGPDVSLASGGQVHIDFFRLVAVMLNDFILFTSRHLADRLQIP